MKKLVPIAVAVVLACAAPEARGQTLLEATGEASWAAVDVQKWLGAGVYDPERLGYGGSATALFGTRGAGGFHYGLEVGWARLMNYSFIFQGDDYESGINMLRIQAVVRFWFDGGSWFGEGVGGIVNLEGASGSGRINDPTLGGGIGKPWALTEQLSLLTRASGNIIFDSESSVLTFRAIVGLSYALGG